MSSFFLFGNFAVAGASRVSAVKKVADTSGERTITTSHYIYDTTVSVRNSETIQASLRVYSPAHDIPLPSQTVVFAIAKAYAPSNGTILLDALWMLPYPGDCEGDSYEDTIPDFPATFAIFTGRVRTTASALLDSAKSKAFIVDVGEYVRDALQLSSIQAVFDGSSARWSKTPAPNPHTTVQVFGLCSGLAVNGSLSVNIDNITFNVGTWQPPQPPADDGTSPSRRRKLTAYAAKRTSVASSSSSSSSSASAAASSSVSSSASSLSSAATTAIPFALPSAPPINPASLPNMLSFVPIDTLHLRTIPHMTSLPSASASTETPMTIARAQSTQPIPPLDPVSQPSATSPLFFTTEPIQLDSASTILAEQVPADSFQGEEDIAELAVQLSTKGKGKRKARN